MDRKTIAVILSVIGMMILGILLMIEKGKTKTNYELMEDLFIGTHNVIYSDEVDVKVLEEARRALLQDGARVENFVEIKSLDDAVYKIQINYDERSNPVIRNVIKN